MRWARTRERSAEFAEFEVVPKTIYSVKLSPSAPSPGCAQDQKSPLVCPADASGSNRRATRAMVKLDEKTRRSRRRSTGTTLGTRSRHGW